MASVRLEQSSSLIYGHPLRLLKDSEIRLASSILIDHIRSLDEKSGSQTHLHFKNISLHDPPKALLLPYLDAEASGISSEQRPYVPRCVDIVWQTEAGRNVTESTISLDSRSVISESHAGKGQHGPNDRYLRHGFSP